MVKNNSNTPDQAESSSLVDDILRPTRAKIIVRRIMIITNFRVLYKKKSKKCWAFAVTFLCQFERWSRTKITQIGSWWNNLWSNDCSEAIQCQHPIPRRRRTIPRLHQKIWSIYTTLGGRWQLLQAQKQNRQQTKAPPKNRELRELVLGDSITNRIHGEQIIPSIIAREFCGRKIQGV